MEDRHSASPTVKRYGKGKTARTPGSPAMGGPAPSVQNSWRCPRPTRSLRPASWATARTASRATTNSRRTNRSSARVSPPLTVRTGHAPTCTSTTDPLETAGTSTATGPGVQHGHVRDRYRPLGDGWDLDGYPDYLWPGTIQTPQPGPAKRTAAATIPTWPSILAREGSARRDTPLAEASTGRKGPAATRGGPRRLRPGHQRTREPGQARGVPFGRYLPGHRHVPHQPVISSSGMVVLERRHPMCQDVFRAQPKVHWETRRQTGDEPVPRSLYPDVEGASSEGIVLPRRAVTSANVAGVRVRSENWRCSPGTTDLEPRAVPGAGDNGMEEATHHEANVAALAICHLHSDGRLRIDERGCIGESRYRPSSTSAQQAPCR